MTATNKLELELLQNAAANQTLANTTFARLNQLVQAGVVDKDLAVPPASPADESLYIVGSSATGAWAGRDGQLAYWLVTAGAWQFVAPREGFFLHVNDEDAFYKFTGTAWEVFSGGGGGGGGMTNPMTAIRDLIVGGVGGAPARLPGPTSEGLVLTRIGNALAWAIATGFANPMTAAGDIIFGGANGAATRLGAGTAGQVLTMVAGAPAWVTPSGGGGGGTGDFKKDGSVQMTAALNEAPVFSLDSASPAESIPDTAIEAANTIKVSGTIGIRYLDFGGSSKLGTKRTLIFDSVLTLYHDLDYLILPGKANITTVIGDSAEFLCEGPNPRKWRCLRYNRADGKALYASSGFTEAQVRNTPLTGLPATTGDVTETDTVLSGIGKLQASKVDKSSAVTSVAGRTGAVTLTKSDVGLANADNTADSAKPVSVAQQAALDLKAPIASPTFSNTARIYGPTGEPRFILDGPAGLNKYFTFYTAGVQRFQFGMSSAAEAGGNAGSNFYINRFGDDGTSIGNVMTATRSSGDIVLWGATQTTGPFRPGQYTLSTLPSAAAYSGFEIDVTNATVAPAGPKRCRSNGANWLILNTNTPVS
jgi:hypothetical protein